MSEERNDHILNPDLIVRDPSLLRRAKLREQDIATHTLGQPSNTARQLEKLEERQKSWFSRFFMERGLASILENKSIQEIRDYKEYRHAVFRLATNTKLEMVHTVCLTLTRELKLATQERFTSLIMDKQEQLRRNVNLKRERFLADMDEMEARIRQYAHIPWLAERALQSLQMEAAQYFDWIDTLLSDFISISSQRLNEYNGGCDRSWGTGSPWRD